MRLAMKRSIPFLVIGIGILLVFGFSCHKETEQDKVKTIITNLQKATEEKDLKTIITSLSKSYSDPQGNNYESIKGLVLAYFYQYPKISMYIPDLDVSVEEQSAKAVFQAVLTARGASASAPTVLPESLGMYAFDLSLKKESGEWKVVSAKWERIGDASKQ
jgi:hypothetical protein